MKKNEFYNETNGKNIANNLFDCQNDVLYAQDDTLNLNHDGNIDENDVTHKNQMVKKERLTYLIVVMMSFTRNMMP